MSHVALQKTKKGKPMYANKNCLIKAANLKGFEVVETNLYHWYMRHVGDYPLPPNMQVSELGKNALFVLRIAQPKHAELTAQNRKQPYDIGVVEDPNNPGCFTLIYDFFGGGYGVDQLLGRRIEKTDPETGEKFLMLCPELKQTYDMVCESEAARETGDSIEYLTLDQARQKYPQYFNNYQVQAQEEKTWVSIANTEQRLGVH